jgi:hypothetical protein
VLPWLGRRIKKTVFPPPPDYDAYRSQWEAIFNEMKDMWADVSKKTLEKVFKKYDTDDSGSIEKDELAAMMAELGTSLTDEQVEAALKDLDMNGDGVVDFSEFASWYFSGMQPYSEHTRAINTVKTTMKHLASGLGDPAILDLVKESKSSMIKQKAAFNFNTTPET